MISDASRSAPVRDGHEISQKGSEQKRLCKVLIGDCVITG